MNSYSHTKPRVLLKRPTFPRKQSVDLGREFHGVSMSMETEPLICVE